LSGGYYRVFNAFCLQLNKQSSQPLYANIVLFSDSIFSVGILDYYLTLLYQQGTYGVLSLSDVKAVCRHYGTIFIGEKLLVRGT